jgi:hypothetical protein
MSGDGYDGWPVLDEAGQRVGKVDEVYEDRDGRARYIGMRAGLLGGSRTLLPADLVEVDESAREVRTPWTKARIKGAPRHDGDEPIDAELQRMVHEHLGRPDGPEAVGGRELTRSEEELEVRLRERVYGSARLSTRVEMEEVSESVPVFADFVQVDEHEVTDPLADSGQIETTPDGDVSVPVMAERLVVTKEQVVVRRVILRRERRQVGEETVSDVLRREVIDLEVDRPDQGEAELARQSGGEDLSRGPTPRTRHPEGGRDDVRDTTQGPTPEIRRAFRVEDADDRAAGEPALDRPTREDRGGSQDRLDDADLTERRSIDPGSPEVEVAGDGPARPAPDQPNDRSLT